MTFFIIILILVLLRYLMPIIFRIMSEYSIDALTKPKNIDTTVDTVGEAISYNEDECSFFAKIAGVNYHATKKQIGGFVGVVVAELENPNSNTATAIYSDRYGRIGYIGREDIKKFKKWNGGLKWPCVGFINEFVNDRGQAKLYGKVKIIKPYNTEYIHEQQKLFLKWEMSSLGEHFVSDELKERFDLI